MLSRLLAVQMRRDLRRSFRRICWVGPVPSLPPGQPAVLYANHHHYYDGYLLWLVITRLLRRRPLTWMAEWDRFPFFAAMGALPFPPHDAQRRVRTVRRTRRLFQEHPDAVLVYFPEGRLHCPEDGLLPISTDALQRLDRLLAHPCWWPVAVHLTWEGGAYPVALLAGGQPTTGPTEDAPERLSALWRTLQAPPPEAATVLMEGRPSPHERWNFHILSPWFESTP
jgi:1-acyl-sn-glycerol-3-phosphate acyltransferase